METWAFMIALPLAFVRTLFAANNCRSGTAMTERLVE